jgi:hypothetical protein
MATTLLLERLAFLRKEVMLLDTEVLKPLADPVSGRYPTCALCAKATLRPCLEIAKAEVGPSEVAVKLPCSHVFGQTCINNYFKTLRPEDQLYNDRCPECNVLLFTQSTVAERYEQAFKVSDSTVHATFCVFAFSMVVLSLFAVASSVLAWQWIFLFVPLLVMARCGVGAFKNHVRVRRELLDLEKGRHTAASTTEQVASPQIGMCDAEPSTEAEASLEKARVADEQKISCSDDDMTIVGHNEDEERTGLLSNTE